MIPRGLLDTGEEPSVYMKMCSWQSLACDDNYSTLFNKINLAAADKLAIRTIGNGEGVCVMMARFILQNICLIDVDFLSNDSIL